MKISNFLSAGHTPALTYATQLLHKVYPFSPAPSPAVTHLLLPVPSFDADGYIHGGGNLEDLLTKFPKDITVVGGLLDHPALAGYNTIDLLKDPFYIAQNANITAHCAIRLALNKLPCTLAGCPVLVIGWGRIGKCLCRLLQGLGAEVTVAARKDTDLAMLAALGYQAIPLHQIDPPQYRLIYNTAPSMVLPQCPGDALKIDLASKLGLGGLDVIWARGLPGKDTPESSGRLIAESIIRILDKE